MTTLNLNQFTQIPVQGERDLVIEQTGIISGVISASQATALTPGTAVKLDTASGLVPSFIAAGQDDVGIGEIIYDLKSSSLNAGDPVQVALFEKSVVMWLTAGGTIAAGAFVEDKGDGTIQTQTSHAMRGQALDPGVATQLMRVFLRNALATA